MKTLSSKCIALMLVLFSSMHIHADNSEYAELHQDVLDLQKRWAKINYQLADKEQELAFEELAEYSEALTQIYCNDAEIWIWNGIILSSYAGAKGGLGALSLAKASKASLEKAMDLDDKALSGSAYTSLGVLYHKVPGWPIGFGSSKKAESYLQNAIAINPKGIDPNYFYGEFLFQNEQYMEAKKHLELALEAPPREERRLADASRKQEVQAILKQVYSILNG